MRGRDVLVTGAGGFIGSQLCRRLVSLGAAVTGVGKSPPPDEFPGRWVQCDLTDWPAVSALVKDCSPSVVFHLAGRTLGGQAATMIWPTLRDNFLATVPLLAALAEMPCERLVLAGSLREPADGDADPIPLSPYAAAKTAASVYARMFGRLYALPVVIARLFMVYGPGRQDLTKLVPYVASQLLAKAEANISSGGAAFDFVFIDDVVDGLLALAETEALEGQIVDIGSGQLATVAQVATLIAERLHRSSLLKFGALPDRLFEPRRVADVNKTAALTGWRAKVSLTEGIDRFLAWRCSMLETIQDGCAGAPRRP